MVVSHIVLEKAPLEHRFAGFVFVGKKEFVWESRQKREDRLPRGIKFNVFVLLDTQYRELWKFQRALDCTSKSASPRWSWQRCAMKESCKAPIFAESARTRVRGPWHPPFLANCSHHAPKNCLGVSFAGAAGCWFCWIVFACCCGDRRKGQFSSIWERTRSVWSSSLPPS